MREFAVEKDQKLSKLFFERLSWLPYYYFKKLLKNKEIRINGDKVNTDTDLKAGDRVAVYFNEKRFPVYTLIYKDENILVADKAKGISSEMLFERLGEEYAGLRFIHRLDTNTAGLILFGFKDSEDELIAAFKDRTVKKIYQCRVYGVPEKSGETLSAYLKKDESLGLVKISASKGEGYLEIITSYKLISDLNDGTSLLEVELITGKTHQIRAHLAYAGYPVIGDGKYGDGGINKRYNESRQQLKSIRLSFGFLKESKLSYLNEKKFEICGIDFKPLKNML